LKVGGVADQLLMVSGFSQIPQFTRLTNISRTLPKSETDAIAWAQTQLPGMPIETIQAEFEQIPVTNGKKATALVERVRQLVHPF